MVCRSRKLIQLCRPYLPCVILAIIVAFYTLVQVFNFTPAYQEVDPDGYLVLAKRIARGEPLAVRDDDPFMYQSHVWVENERGETIPKFAPGYPLLLSAFYLIFGDEGMFYVSPLMGGIALIGAYLLFTRWMSTAASLVAALTLAANAMFLIYSGYLLAHASNLCFVTWGMFFLWKWVKDPSVRYGVGAGLTLGYAVTIRPTSILLAFAVAIAAVSSLIEGRKSRLYPFRELAALAACYALFPLLLALYNRSVFGSPFVTGYFLSGEQYAYSLSSFAKNIHTINRGLSFEALFMVFPIGLLGMVLLGTWTDRLMRLMWFLPVYILYASFYWAPPGMSYLRFLICTFPVFVGSSYAFVDRISESKAKRYAAIILLCFFIVAIRLHSTVVSMKTVVSDQGSRNLVFASRVASETLDSNAVILSRYPVYCYLGTRENFRFYDLKIFSKRYGQTEFRDETTIRKERKRRWRYFPAPRRQEKRTKCLRELYSNLNSSQLKEKKRDLIESFLKNSRQVAFLIPKNHLDRERKELGAKVEFSMLKEWDMLSGEKWALYEVRLGSGGDI